MERRVMYATDGKGQAILMDQCSFCIHYDRNFPYKKCKYADFEECLDDCAGYAEIAEQDQSRRFRALFSRQ